MSKLNSDIKYISLNFTWYSSIARIQCSNRLRPKADSRGRVLVEGTGSPSPPDRWV